MIQFRCQGCGTGIRVSDDKAGKRGRCPKCSAIVRVPAAAMAPPVVPTAEVPEPTPDSTPDPTAEPARANPVGRRVKWIAAGTGAVLLLSLGLVLLLGGAAGLSTPVNEELSTAVGELDGAFFSNEVGMYFYDEEKVLDGIKLQRPFLAVRFKATSQQIGPWHAGDITVRYDGKTYEAAMVDVGGEGLYWHDIYGNPAVAFDTLTRTSGDVSIVVLTFSGVPQTARSVEVCYNGKEATVHVPPWKDPDE